MPRLVGQKTREPTSEQRYSISLVAVSNQTLSKPPVTGLLRSWHEMSESFRHRCSDEDQIAKGWPSQA